MKKKIQSCEAKSMNAHFHWFHCKLMTKSCLNKSYHQIEIAHLRLINKYQRQVNKWIKIGIALYYWRVIVGVVFYSFAWRLNDSCEPSSESQFIYAMRVLFNFIITFFDASNAFQFCCCCCCWIKSNHYCELNKFSMRTGTKQKKTIEGNRNIEAEVHSTYERVITDEQTEKQQISRSMHGECH